MGCGRIAFESSPIGDAKTVDTRDTRDDALPPTCGAWTAPTLIPGIGNAGLRAGSVAPDGLSLVTIDFNNGAVGYYSTRTARDQAFTPPTPIPGISANLWDTAPFRGGTRMIYAVGGNIACPLEITSTGSPYAFVAPSLDATTGCMPAMTGVALLEDGLTAYSSNAVNQLQVSVRGTIDDPFTSVTPHPELTMAVRYPAIRGDQRELVFENSDAGSLDLYIATRADLTMPWGVPERLPFMTDTFTEDDASFTADGTELYFTSDRSGAFEMYVMTRTCN